MENVRLSPARSTRRGSAPEPLEFTATGWREGGLGRDAAGLGAPVTYSATDRGADRQHGTPPAEGSRHSNYRIARWSAEFIEPEVEADFRRRAARGASRQAVLGLTLAALAFVVFVISDIATLGWGEQTRVPATIGMAVAATALFALAWVAAHPRAATGGAAVSIWELVALTGCGVIALLRGVSLELGSLSMLAMLAGVYFFLPNRAIYMIAIGVSASLGYVGGTWLLGPAMEPARFIDVSLLLALVNGFGVIGAWRLSIMPREEYRLLARSAQANARLAEEIGKRARLERKLERLATTDALTDLSNRRRYVERTLEELQRARRARRSLAVLILDMDSFKQINDRFGHAAGDRALRSVSRVLRRELRNTDLIARYGGEEFAITLPEADVELALQVAERLRAAIADTRLDRTVRLSVTIGVAIARDGEDLDGLLNRADKALYAGKDAGRNQVKLAPDAAH